MKFAVESLQKGCARLGVLTKTDQIKCETPLLLLYTKAGSIPYLSHEVLDYMQFDGCSKALEISMDTIHHMQKALSTCGQSILSYAGYLDGYISFATLKNPAEVCPSGFHDKDQISIFSRSGRKTVSADDYMNLVEACKPDIFQALCDGDTNVSSTKKRISKSVLRTESFTKKCLDRYKESSCLKNSMFVASIEGGYSIQARENMIKSSTQIEIGGYLLDGFHNNGPEAALINVDDNNLIEIIRKCNEMLPHDKPKFMLGAYNPATMLKLIHLGIDVFDSCFAYLATTLNCALTFSFDNASTETNDFDLDFSNERFKDEFQPIVKECRCLTCRKHSRAYVHHLVNTKELLAPILLMIHNTHHYIEFFKAIRTAIANDSLPKMIELVQKQLDNGSKFMLKIEQKVVNDDNQSGDSVVLAD